MNGSKIARHGRLLSYNGFGFFKLPGQIAALRPTVIRNASTTSGLWLPKNTQVRNFSFFFFKKYVCALNAIKYLLTITYLNFIETLEIARFSSIYN